MATKRTTTIIAMTSFCRTMFLMISNVVKIENDRCLLVPWFDHVSSKVRLNPPAGTSAWRYWGELMCIKPVHSMCELRVMGLGAEWEIFLYLSKIQASDALIAGKLRRTGKFSNQNHYGLKRPE